MLTYKARAMLNQLTKNMKAATYEEQLKHIELIVEEVYGVKLRGNK